MSLSPYNFSINSKWMGYDCTLESVNMIHGITADIFGRVDTTHHLHMTCLFLDHMCGIADNDPLISSWNSLPDISISVHSVVFTEDKNIAALVIDHSTLPHFLHRAVEDKYPHITLWAYDTYKSRDANTLLREGGYPSFPKSRHRECQFKTPKPKSTTYSNRVECHFFNTSKGCRAGDKCTYLHSRKSSDDITMMDQIGSSSRRNDREEESKISRDDALESSHIDMSSSPSNRKRPGEVNVFCDLDGTLADFEWKCSQVIGNHWKSVQERDISNFWSIISNYKDNHRCGFYASLPWLKGR